jgi:hypothetical protein
VGQSVSGRLRHRHGSFGQLIFFPPSNQGGNKPRYRSRICHLTSRAPNLLFSCSMKIGRIILALMIALSVAMLPAAGGGSAVMKSIDSTDMAAMEDMDCCPHKASPCDMAMDGCASMAACALTWLTFSDTASSPVIFPSRLAQLNPALGTSPFKSQTGIPPFRPPRV